MSVSETPAPGHLLQVRRLDKSYGGNDFLRRGRRITAVHDVSFRLRRGEAVALVGESGSGKSTVARLLLRLERPGGGEIRLDGENVLEREPRGASLAYRRRVQMVFQDPFGSLNPAHDVAHHLVRPLRRHRHVAGAAEAHRRALELLRTVGLEPAEEFIHRRPYELSGGQRQRVAIARALAVEPEVLVADEPTSMLDVSIRMGILKLLASLKREGRLAILLITHDLASAHYLADRVLVLFRGRIVEEGTPDLLVERPAHPYTRALLGAIAGADRRSPVTSLPARGPAEGPAPAGCPFAPRCPDVLARCREEDPRPRTVEGRSVRCHLYPEGARR